MIDYLKIFFVMRVGGMELGNGIGEWKDFGIGILGGWRDSKFGLQG